MTELTADLITRITSDNTSLTARVGDLEYERLQLKEEVERLNKRLLEILLDQEQLKNQFDAVCAENEDLQGQLQDLLL